MLPTTIKVAPAAAAKKSGQPIEFDKAVTVSYYGIPLFLPAYTLVYGKPGNIATRSTQKTPLP